MKAICGTPVYQKLLLPKQDLGSVAPVFSMEQCTSENISNDKFVNKTHRMMKPHWPEPNTLYKVGNMGRNWVCSRSSLSLDPALWHPDKTSGTPMTILEVRVLNDPGAWRTQRRQRPSHRPPSANLLVLFVCFFSLVIAPSERAILSKHPVSFLEQPIEFLVGLYHWYRREKKSRHI